MSNIPQELVQIQQLVNRLGVAGLLRFVACDCADRATGDDSERWELISRWILRTAEQIHAIESPPPLVSPSPRGRYAKGNAELMGALERGTKKRMKRLVKHYQQVMAERDRLRAALARVHAGSYSATKRRK